MIQQFAELGQFFREREGVKDQLVQYAQDPSKNGRRQEVLLLVFSDKGFERIQMEEYDQERRLRYLYRQGPPNGWDATPTTGMPTVKKGEEATADTKIGTRLARLARSIGEALDRGQGLPEWERDALALMRDGLQRPEKDAEADPRKCIFDYLREAHPDLTKPAILSVAWETSAGGLQRVGDFQAFRDALIRKGNEAGSKKKTIKGEVKGVGQCCVCGKRNTEVFGLLKVWNPPLYTLDKPGSVSGGFDRLGAWRNFPTCRECFEKVDFSVERIKTNLSFDFYGFKYLLLPLPVQPAPTQAFELLDRLIRARVDNIYSKRLTDAEEELFYVIANEEQNRLQVDLLFYQPDQQSFRPKLYVSGLLPSRFRELFKAKEAVDQHPWLQQPSPKPFTSGTFTFRSLRKVLPAEHGGSTFDDDFIAATRAALELRPYPTARLLELGMRWVQQDYIEGKAWPFRLADLFRSLLFFERLTADDTSRRLEAMIVDYGDSEQADRVRAVFGQAPEGSRLRVEAAAQAAFLIGACCGRIERIQEIVRGATPFSGKLKGFRLRQGDVRELFRAAKEKAAAYGTEQERKVSGLLGCAAAALLASSDEWALSPDEISYYFALGHALRPRLAKERDEAQNAAEPEAQE